MSFCRKRQVSTCTTDVPVILDFLVQLSDTGLGYSSINAAKSAVLAYVSLCSGSEVEDKSGLLHRFLRGIFIRKPTLPRYSSTWDTQIVVKYLRSMFPLKCLNLLRLSQKLLMLLVLLTGQRGQSIHLLNVEDLECGENCLIIRFKHVLKTSRPGVHMDEIVLPAFKDTPELCVLVTFKAFITRTSGLRGKNRRLFVSTLKPHGPLSRDSVRNWTKAIMTAAGVDLNIFGAHSTRAAATSKAQCKGVSLNTIIKTAGWSQEQTFRRFYDKPITRNVDFAKAVVDM